MDCANDLAECIKARNAAARRVRTPNCTHVNMDRVYGREQYCFVCGRAPSVGFLYVCRQDHVPIPSTSDSLEAHNQGSPGQEVSPKSELRQELEEIGLSESVILAAERDEYTPAQLAKLKALKIELKQAIEDTMQGVQINGVATKLAAFANGPSNNDGTSNSSLQKDPVRYSSRKCFVSPSSTRRG